MSLFPPNVPSLGNVARFAGACRPNRRPFHGSPDAQHARISRIFRQYAPEIKPFLLRRGVSIDDADDVIQRVFMVLAGRIGDVLPGRERAFLYRVALNESFHQRRSFARRCERAEEVEAITSVSVLPDELLGRKLASERLHGALKLISRPLREVFEMVEVQGLSLAQAAERLRLPVGTAKTRLRRAKALLGSTLHGLEQPD